MRNAFLGACLVIFVAATAIAQAPVGTISGTVRDQTEAVVPGATITIRHAATGAERHLTSGSDGAFAAPALAAGEYRITAELSGFRTLQREVTVATGRVLTVDLHMEIGQASEVVNVAAAAVHVDVETHGISGVITRQKIQELRSTAAASCSWRFSNPGFRRVQARRRSTTHCSQYRFSAATPTRPPSRSTAATSAIPSKATPG